MGRARFGKVLTAMATPFAPDGSLDADGARTVARWLVDHGSDGLVLAGTTGEAPTLSDDEKVALWEAVRAAVDVPLLAGAGSNDTRHS
ncbi:MAG: dihydrodipicolinate synthase family protein, partial [Acidimicrobiales bacterium]